MAATGGSRKKIEDVTMNTIARKDASCEPRGGVPKRHRQEQLILGLRCKIHGNRLLDRKVDGHEEN